MTTGDDDGLADRIRILMTGAALVGTACEPRNPWDPPPVPVESTPWGTLSRRPGAAQLGPVPMPAEDPVLTALDSVGAPMPDVDVGQILTAFVASMEARRTVESWPDWMRPAADPDLRDEPAAGVRSYRNADGRRVVLIPGPGGAGLLAIRPDVCRSTLDDVPIRIPIEVTAGPTLPISFGFLGIPTGRGASTGSEPADGMPPGSLRALRGEP